MIDRKNTRMHGYNYNSVGVYFITICTYQRKNILSEIVGTGVPDGPYTSLTEYGKIADKYIKQLDAFYTGIQIDDHVIMPNHIHLLLRITERGPSRTPVPTTQNSTLSRFISTFKRFCNKEYGKNIWQSRSYDHIIRNHEDYAAHVKYIRENPLRWQFDELYTNK